MYFIFKLDNMCKLFIANFYIPALTYLILVSLVRLLALLDCMQLLIEFISDVQKFLLNFGLYSNTKRLLDTNPPKGDHLACLDGIRFVSITWVMLGHGLQAEIDRFPITNVAFFTQVSIKDEPFF